MKTEEVVITEETKYPFDCPLCLKQDPPVKKRITGPTSWKAHHGWNHDPASRKKRLRAAKEQGQLRVGTKRVVKVYGNRTLTEKQLEDRRKNSRDWRAKKKQEREQQLAQHRNYSRNWYARKKKKGRKGPWTRRKELALQHAANGATEVVTVERQTSVFAERRLGRIAKFLYDLEVIEEALRYADQAK
jgi:hypothetical protein